MTFSARLRGVACLKPLLVLFLSLAPYSATAQEEVRVGYAILTAEPGGLLPVGGALFSLRNASGTLVSEAGVGAVRPLRAGRIFVDQDGTRTGLALANPSAESVAVDLVVRDGLGNGMAQTRISLGARQHQAQFVDELFPDLPAGFVGSLTFSAPPNQEVAAVTLRLSVNRFGEPLFATLPVATLDDGAAPAGPGNAAVIFPHLGAGGGILSTQIILINRGSGTVRGRIEFTGVDGAPLTVELDGASGSAFPYELRPDGAFRATLTRAAGVVQGYAVVTVDGAGGPPAGTAIFQFRDPLGRLVSEAGVGATPATSRARIFVDNAATSTGIAVAGPAAEPTRVDFELLDRNGNSIDAASRNLPARGQTAIFADQLFPGLPVGFTGQMEIRSDRPIVPITVKLTTNPRNDLIVTTLPVADLEAPGEGGRLVFPQIGFGAGFATRLILISGDPVQSFSGTLEFRRSDGSNLMVTLGENSGSVFPVGVPPASSRQLRPGNTARPVAIVIDPADPEGLEVVVNRGDTLALDSIVVDEEGAFRDDFQLEYASLSPEVASVDELGRIRGNDVGFSTLTVGAGDAVAASAINVVEVTTGAGGLAVTGLVRDFAGRTYLAGSRSHTIRLATDPEQPAQIYAGIDGTAGLRDGQRLQSLFDSPAFLAFNQVDGSLYVSDRENHAIRRIGPGSAGMVETLAGGGQPGSSDGSFLQARFNNPSGVALDSRGRLWIADSENHAIRLIDLATGSVETVAGLAGSPGFRDGQGQEARFSSPTGLAMEPEPLAAQLGRERTGGPPPPLSVLVADRGNGALRRVREDGRVTTVGVSDSVAAGQSAARAEAGVGFDSPTAVAADSLGRIYVSEPDLDRVTVLLPSGRRVAAAQRGTLLDPAGIAITESGEVTVGVGDRTLVRVAYGAPEILQPPAGEGGRIVLRGRNFAPDTTVVIPGVAVQDVRVEDTSTLSFSLAASNRIEDSLLTVLNRAGARQRPVRVFPDRTIGDPTTGLASFFPSGLDLDSSGDILAATGGDVMAVFRIRAATGTANRAAGGPPGGGGDGGPAKEAGLNGPAGLAADRRGNFFIADANNHRVRWVDAESVIRTAAGDGSRGFSGDGGPAAQAQLDRPQGVAVDLAGNLFIADTGNHRIRRVDAANGTITTVAGDGADRFSGDGGAAVNASLSGPRGLALDASGDLFIADQGNNRIRRVAADTGIISTVAGNGQSGFSGDGQQATAARLNFPTDVAVDIDGNVWIADTFNRRVRRVAAGTGTITTVAGNGGNTDNRQAGGPALSFPLFDTVALAVDAAGNIFILENSAGSQTFQVLRVNGVTGIVTAYRVEALLAD